MLTAADAHKISKSVAEKDVTKVEVKHYVKDILVDVKKDAEQGCCQHSLDFMNYSKNMRMPIVHMLEDLGYKVLPHTWLNGIYIISW